MDQFLRSGRPILGLSEVIFDLWEAKSALWEASSRVWGPRSETRTLILTSGRPKSVVPRQISPMGERILTSEEVKTRSIWPILGSRGPQKANFWDPSLEKVAEFWPRMGIGSPFLDPEGSANPEGP